MEKKEGEVVCVTGGSGFIGSWIVDFLLRRDYTVHATVKDLGDEKETKHLEAMDGADSHLRLFQMDLLRYDSIVAAVSGATGVVHVASPCSVDQVHDPQRELLEPAIKGTVNVLTAAKELGVRRVVVTSSISAMLISPDCLADAARNEDCWADEESCKHKGLLSMAEISKIHPATTITNIRTHIPVILDYAGTQYNNWSTLFRLHCRAYLVISHIIPAAPKQKDDSTPSTEEDLYAALIPWQRLDDIVRQWIYGTVSPDLLNTILSSDDSAMETWNRLERLFQGNKSARALQYDTQLSNVKLENFHGVKEYCTTIKTLADNLRNVGSPVTDEQMVLRLLRGLGDDYKPFRTSIQHLKPLPDFETVRTMLELEETSNEDASTNVATALAAHDSAAVNNSLESSYNSSSYNNNGRGSSYNDNNNHARQNNNNRNRNHHNNRNNSRGGGNNNRGGGGRSGRGGRGGSSHGGRGSGGQQPPVQQQQQAPHPFFWCPPQWLAWQQQPWATPPCPYPTSGQPQPRSTAPGILGPQPQLFYSQQQPASTPSSLVPTNIEQAMHTLALQQPDPQWYMDTGATSHMTSSEAWEFAEKNGLDIVVVNPGTVMGPVIPPAINASMRLTLSLLQGNEVPAEFFMGFVHVKDVALAHILVYENTAATGRHLCIGSLSQYDDFAAKITELYPEYKVPRKPKITQLGSPITKDASRKLVDLGLEFISLDEIIKDSVESLRSKGYLS